MRLARKLFRLYKSVVEYQKFMDLLDKTPSNTDEINLILSRICSNFSARWKSCYVPLLGLR